MDKGIDPYNYGRVIGLIVDAVQEMPWVIPVNNRGELEFAQATADKIIKIVQGDNKMDKKQLNDMVFGLVYSAMREQNNALKGGQNYDVYSAAVEHSEKVVNNVLDGVGIVNPPVSEFVDKYYEMDPETEDVLDNGSLIADGMMVLIESPTSRETIKENMTPFQISEARMSNRWCTVTGSKVVGYSSGPMIEFVGIYEDGVKRKRATTVNLAWIVKKDSIPRIDELIGVEGFPIYTGTTAKVVETLKTVDRKYWNGCYKVRVGGENETVSVEEYLRFNDVGEDE